MAAGDDAEHRMGGHGNGGCKGSPIMGWPSAMAQERGCNMRKSFWGPSEGRGSGTQYLPGDNPPGILWA